MSPGLILEEGLCNLPKGFQDYKDCRVVIDCTELFTEKPSSITAQWLTWSEYKHSNTFKLLTGVAPNGLVNFISRLCKCLQYEKQLF
jgi:hypothetical protein